MGYRFHHRSTIGRYICRPDARTATPQRVPLWPAWPTSIVSLHFAQPEMTLFVSKRPQAGMPEPVGPRLHVLQLRHYSNGNVHALDSIVKVLVQAVRGSYQDAGATYQD